MFFFWGLWFIFYSLITFAYTAVYQKIAVGTSKMGDGQAVCSLNLVFSSLFGCKLILTDSAIVRYFGDIS